jgi:hypothetical protein
VLAYTTTMGFTRCVYEQDERVDCPRIADAQ